MADEKGYPKWAVNNTSTQANDPANEINRAKGQPNKIAPSSSINGGVQTVTDGKTKVTTDVAVQERENYHSRSGQWPPCINPQCKSYGRSHPNCLCYGAGSGEDLYENFAHGGQVCKGLHKDDCEHYASGGVIAENQKFQNDPNYALDHTAISHGLLGLLTKVGHSKSHDPHKHY